MTTWLCVCLASFPKGTEQHKSLSQRILSVKQMPKRNPMITINKIKVLRGTANCLGVQGRFPGDGMPELDIPEDWWNYLGNKEGNSLPIVECTKSERRYSSQFKETGIRYL